MLTPLSAPMLLLAADAAPAAAPGPFSGMLDLLPVVAIFGVLYFLMIRPASKQRREQQAVLAALKKDDEIVTQGGMWGRIVALDAHVATLEIADRVKVRLLRDRIAGRWQPGAAVASTPSAAAPAAAAK